MSFEDLTNQWQPTNRVLRGTFGIRSHDPAFGMSGTKVVASALLTGPLVKLFCGETWFFVGLEFYVAGVELCDF